jgi:serine phosphatase RsbU (regulator of sigma subunit)/CHASE3 domain sensor protein
MSPSSPTVRQRTLGSGSLRGVLGRLVLAIALVLCVLIAVAVAGTILASNEYRDGSVLAVNRQGAANQLLVDLLNAETANRGYTLTGRGDYLEPYVNARQRYPRDLARLRRLVRDDPSLTTSVDAVDRTALLWFDEARRLIRLRRQGRVEAAIARVNEGVGQARFQAFRQGQTSLLGEVQRLRGASLAAADDRRNWTIVAIAAAAALALLVTAIVVRHLWRRMGGPVQLLSLGVERVARGRFSDPVPQSPGAVRELAGLTDGFNEMQHDLEQQREAVRDAALREAAQATERRMWETVQRGLLPSRLPATPGLRLAARYQAAEPALLIGGDFYDAVLLGDGRTALVVGDLAGHGAQAAARAAGLRFAWRALVASDPNPNLVMSNLNAQLTGSEERSQGIFASLIYALIDPEGGVQFSLAGHPPPLLLSATDSVPVSADERGPLLGVFNEAEWPVIRVDLPPGGTLVLYTDGLLEARQGVDLFGPERACAVLAAERRAALEERLARLVEAARRHDSENLRDDVVVLGVERVTEVPAGPEPLVEPAAA